MKTALAVVTALLLPFAAAAQTEPAKAKKEPPKSAPKKAPAAPVVGSMDAAPEKKLGAAKEPCVYKPVMTAEDMENCR
jgi:hypothetical protein